MKKKTDDQREVLQGQGEEWKAKYLRALADYQNLQRHTQEEKSKTRRFASEMMVAKLLPALDTFEKAGKHLKDEGLNLAIAQFLAILKSEGMERIDVTGNSFNPQEMECVEAVEGSDGVVVEEVLPGYTLHGKVIRVAQVKVGKKKGENYG